MSYFTKNLASAAECDRAISWATDRKNDLIFDQSIAQKDATDTTKSVDMANANMLIVVAQITGTEAALVALPEGDAKKTMANKLRRLNDRRDNLVEKLESGGAVATLESTLEASLLSVQLVEIDAFLNDVLTRKSEL